MTKITIDYSGLRSSNAGRAIASQLDQAFSDPARASVFDRLIEDLQPGITSIKVVPDYDIGTWQISPDLGKVTIRVNPLADINKNFSADSVLAHEISHGTQALDNLSRVAVDAFIKTSKSEWAAIEEKFGPVKARLVVNYAFEEFFNQVLDNQYRIAHGQKYSDIGKFSKLSLDARLRRGIAGVVQFSGLTHVAITFLGGNRKLDLDYTERRGMK